MIRPDVKSVFRSPTRLTWLICLVGIVLVLLTAVRSLPQIETLFLEADNDDLMRMVQVRDWRAGQGWFDMRQYRVLPPDGISMHWSRYVDVGIAGVLALTSWVLPVAQAELATLILWPSLLACLMVLLVGYSSARLFGPPAAIGAIAVFLSWSKLGGEFVPPRIDHHNVQLLITTAIFYVSVLPGRPQLSGALAGLLTGLSLAVGLEMLPFLAVIWGLMAVRHAWGQDGTGHWLLGFAAAFGSAAPLLMAGQLPVGLWTVPRCDALATPVLALGAVGIAATLAPVLAARQVTGPGGRLLLLFGIAVPGLWLAWPLLAPCLSGPYAEVSPAARDIIETRVTEALSARRLLGSDPGLLLRVLLPPVLVACLAGMAAIGSRRRLTPTQASALVQALVVVAAGLAVAMTQIRAANLMAPAVPLLAGFLVTVFSWIPRASALRAPAALLLLFSLPPVIERGADLVVRKPTEPGDAAKSASVVPPLAGCRSASAVAELASLEHATLFPTLNMGPLILATTSHAVTAAPYHRSPEAFWNGIGAFQTEAALGAAVARSQADYVVLCAGSGRERDLPEVDRLLAGQLPVWLSDVSGDRQLIRVLKVDPARLPGQP